MNKDFIKKIKFQYVDKINLINKTEKVNVVEEIEKGNFGNAANCRDSFQDDFLRRRSNIQVNKKKKNKLFRDLMVKSEFEIPE